jgi:hypothetical protein
MDETGMLEVAQRFSQMLSPGDLDHTLSEITAAAVAVLPDVAHSSITVRHADAGDGRSHRRLSL